VKGSLGEKVFWTAIALSSIGAAAFGYHRFKLIRPDLFGKPQAVLKEGIVPDAELIDAGLIFGTGFAPFRGGPIQYIRSEGADKLKAQLAELASKYGKRFEPKAGWDSAALRADA